MKAIARSQPREPWRAIRRTGEAETFLVAAATPLPDVTEREEAACEGDERTGLKILESALETPTRAIAENSGFDDGVVVEHMRSGTGNYGFDAARGTYCDLAEAGIIDPTKVVRLALENAVSVASVLLLSEATMTEPPEPVKTEHQALEA
ncbi:MAG: groEL [Deltaproteobacteria bacterium]|nr:groEL [Deltaproteobacteria bacterium]